MLDNEIVCRSAAYNPDFLVSAAFWHTVVAGCGAGHSSGLAAGGYPAFAALVYSGLPVTAILAPLYIAPMMTKEPAPE
jgi:hypothetical protein